MLILKQILKFDDPQIGYLLLKIICLLFIEGTLGMGLE